MKTAAIIILLIVGISTAYANFMLLHVGPGGFGGGGPSVPNCLLADTGNEILADAGNCILVQ